MQKKPLPLSIDVENAAKAVSHIEAYLDALTFPRDPVDGAGLIRILHDLEDYAETEETLFTVARLTKVFEERRFDLMRDLENQIAREQAALMYLADLHINVASFKAIADERKMLAKARKADEKAETKKCCKTCKQPMPTKP